VEERGKAQQLNESNRSLQENLESYHHQCQKDIERLAGAKQAYIDQRIGKSQLLQQTLGHQTSLMSNLTQPVSDEGQKRGLNAATTISRPAQFQSVEPNVSPILNARIQQERSHWSESERVLAATLELQLGSLISKLHHVCQ